MDAIAVLPNGEGVCLSGRFAGWLFRKHPDGQWISIRKLELRDPAEGNPLAALFPPWPGAAEGNEAEAAPKPDPAIAEVVERLRERTKIAYAGSCKCGECQLVPITLIYQAIAVLTASNDRVAELGRENFALAANQCDGPKHGDEHGHAYCPIVEALKKERDEAREWTKAWHSSVQTISYILGLGEPDADTVAEQVRDKFAAAEAEVSRLKAGAVTDEMVEAAKAASREVWRGPNTLDLMNTDPIATRAMRAALEAALSNQAGASE